MTGPQIVAAGRRFSAPVDADTGRLQRLPFGVSVKARLLWQRLERTAVKEHLTSNDSTLKWGLASKAKAAKEKRET